MGFWPEWMQKFLPPGKDAAPPAPAPAPIRTRAQADLLEHLEQILRDTNIQAFGHVVREGETDHTDDAYRYLYGSNRRTGLKLFASFADHPRQWFSTPWGNTSAAGAYQAMCAVPGKVKTDTWGDFVKAVGPMDFSPHSQDLFYAWCIHRRHAVRDIVAGDLMIAIEKCNEEWASLPGSPHGQPVMTPNRAGSVFKQFGGQIRGQT